LLPPIVDRPDGDEVLVADPLERKLAALAGGSERRRSEAVAEIAAGFVERQRLVEVGRLASHRCRFLLKLGDTPRSRPAMAASEDGQRGLSAGVWVPVCGFAGC